MQALVDEDFQVPEGLLTEDFRLEVLTPRFAELDYEAVMSSRRRLRTVFAASTEWPQDDMTLEQDIADLENHQHEFVRREAFAYTVLSSDGERCVGCLYIEPSRLEVYDCEVYLWLRDDCVGLDEQFCRDVKEWLDDRWPFEAIAFPGRDIPWERWSLPGSHPRLPD